MVSCLARRATVTFYVRKSSLFQRAWLAPKVVGLGTTSCVFHSIKTYVFSNALTQHCHLILLQQTSEISYVTDTCSLWQEELFFVVEADLNIERCILKCTMPKCKHSLLIITSWSSSRNYNGTSTSQKFLCKNENLTYYLQLSPTYLTCTWKLVGEINRCSTFLAIVVNCGQPLKRRDFSSSFMNRVSDHQYL
jgi:hypothetical protein